MKISAQNIRLFSSPTCTFNLPSLSHSKVNSPTMNRLKTASVRLRQIHYQFGKFGYHGDNMNSKYAGKAYTETTVHKYHRNLIGIEHPTRYGAPHTNTVVFIGGLGDGITTVPYVKPLADALDKAGWGVVELLTTSSFGGWGTGSLERDAEEVEKAVEYLTTKLEAGGLPNKQKVVLLGHSTGCQDIMYYLTRGKERAKIDGAILQAGVSDRDATVLNIGEKKWKETVAAAQKLVDEGKGDTVLSGEFAEIMHNTPISASRFVALNAPRGDDDFFSIDLPDSDLEKSFGQIKVPLLFLMSGSDAFVDPKQDKQKIVDRYESFVKGGNWSELSGVIDGASHNVGRDSKEGAVDAVVEKIESFVKSI